MEIESFLTKEDFIFEKNNSMTKGLCADMIDAIKKMNDIELNFDLLYEEKWNKAKLFIINELGSCIDEYSKKLSVRTMNQDNYKILSFDRNSIDRPSCSIKKYIYRGDICEYGVEVVNKIISKKYISKKLIYIWFMNDYDGEIIFWNNHKIIPKAGKLIIFPVSCCFPYQEMIKPDTDKYVITGYIY
jgi:hypothetical protein